MKTNQFIASIILIVALSGCTRSHYLRGDVDGLIEEVGAIQVNGLIVEERSGGRFLQSYGRISGDLRSIDLSELQQVAVASSETLEVRVLSLLEHAGDVERLVKGKQQVSLGNSVVRALTMYVSSFPALHDLTVRLKVVLAPENSGVSIIHRSAITDSASLVLVISFPDDTEFPAVYWWANIATTAVHELFHLNFDLGPANHGRVNEETAASLLETCLNTNIAIETQSPLGFSSDILNPRNRRFFPEIERNEFRPAADQLATLPHASIQGASLANAIVFLQTGRETFLFRDSVKLEPLSQACLDFGTEVPDFLAGERPWL